MSKSPALNPEIIPEGRVSGGTVRKAFLLEALANLMSIPLITHTRPTLRILLNNPTHINPSTILFARLFGGIVVGGLTSALLAGYTNTRNGIESRRVVYLLLGVGEVLLIPILAQQAMLGGGKDAALSIKVAVGTILCLLPPLMWRVYVLALRPDLLGRYREKDA